MTIAMTWPRINTMHKPELVSHLLAYYQLFSLIKDVSPVVVAVFDLPVNQLKRDLYIIAKG